MNSKVLTFAALGIIAAGGLYYVSTQEPSQTPVDTTPTNVQEVVEGEASPSNEQVETVEAITKLPSIEDMTAPRVVGLATAPLKITEYSSMTCSHCGDFHVNTLDRLIADFVLPGKVQFEFVDFPFDQAALEAAMISRCAPKEKHFEISSILFKNQGKWAFADDYVPFLKETAAKFGISGPIYDECLANDYLRNFIVSGRGEAQAKLGVASTPTFLFKHDLTNFSGNQPYDYFAQVIEQKLTEIENAEEEEVVEDTATEAEEETETQVEQPDIQDLQEQLQGELEATE